MRFTLSQRSALSSLARRARPAHPEDPRCTPDPGARDQGRSRPGGDSDVLPPVRSWAAGLPPASPVPMYMDMAAVALTGRHHW